MAAPPTKSVLYRFADYEVTPEDGILIRRGLKVRLQDQPFRLLVLLVSRAGTVVTRQDIQSHLWPGNTNVEFDKSLRVAMSKLREALRDPAEQPIYIETIPRRGYRFMVSVVVTELAVIAPALATESGTVAGSAVDTLAAGSADATVRSVAGTASSSALGWLARMPRWVWGAALLLLILSAYLTRLGAHRPLATPVAARPEARLSVAVLSLRNLDGRAEDRWLSTALVEMLSTELASSDRIRVLSGEQVARAGLSEVLANSPSRETIAQIARQLGVDLVLFGSYTVSGAAGKGTDGKGTAAQLRVDLRMENPSSDNPPFALVETGLATDVFSVVSASGSQLRQRLGIGGASAGTLTAVRLTLPTDINAAQLYAEGLDRLRDFDPLHARDLLQKAARIEPTHASTHLALADAWHSLGYDTEARAEAARAVELATGLPREERLMMEAQSAALTHDWHRATDIFRSLITFYPDNIDYGVRLARSQVSAGNVPEALTTLQELRRQSPSRADDAHIELAEAYAQLHHNEYPQSLAAADRAVKIGTDLGQRLVRAEGLWMKASSLERLGKAQESLQASAEAKNLYRDSGDKRGFGIVLLLSGDVLYDQGKLDDARKEFQTALEVFRSIGHTVNTGVTLERIGNCYFDEGKLAESRELYQQSLAAYRAVPWQEGIPSAIGNIANVLEQEGDIEGSLRLNAQGLAEFERTGQQRGFAATLVNMGDLEMQRGSVAAAAKHYDRAVEVYTHIAYARGIADALVGQGGILVARNNLSAALERYQQALKTIQGMDEPSVTGSVQGSVGAATLLAGHAAEALPHLQQSVDSAMKEKNHVMAADGYSWICRALLMQGHVPEAAAAADRAVAESQKQFAPRPKLTAALALARVQIAQGKLAEAKDSLHASSLLAQKHSYMPLALEARIVLARTETNAAERRRQLNVLSAEAADHEWKDLAAYARTAAP